MQGKRTPVILISRHPPRTEHYSSVREASRALGVSTGKLARGLQSKSGVIPGTDPPICIDEDFGDEISESEQGEKT